MRPKIIWIDDDHDQYGAQCEAARKNGWTIIESKSVADFLKLASDYETSKDDLLSEHIFIIDAMMDTHSDLDRYGAHNSLMTGWALAKYLIEEKKIDKDRILIFTGNSDIDLKQALALLGVKMESKFDYMGKAFVNLLTEHFDEKERKGRNR